MTDRVHNLIDWGRSDELDSRDVGDLVSTVKALRSEIEASARARRVGEAVIGVISGLSADDCDKIADNALAGRVYDRDRLGLAHMMRTLAAALRGEP